MLFTCSSIARSSSGTAQWWVVRFWVCESVVVELPQTLEYVRPICAAWTKFGATANPNPPGISSRGGIAVIIASSFDCFTWLGANRTRLSLGTRRDASAHTRSRVETPGAAGRSLRFKMLIKESPPVLSEPIYIHPTLPTRDHVLVQTTPSPTPFIGVAWDLDHSLSTDPLFL